MMRTGRNTGALFETSPIEIVNVRVTGVGRLPKLTQLRAPSGGALADAKVKVGACVFRVGGKLQSFDTTFYQRQLLAVGCKDRRSRDRLADGTARRSFRRA